jgi:gliding motility-associated-like protein
MIDSITGGNFPYDLQWGGVNSFALSAGSYLVHIVDSIGCLHTEIYVISQGNQINPNEAIYPSLCNGDNNGSISIDISGGTGVLSYYWLNGMGTVDSLYGLSDNIYTLIISDSLGCIDTIDFYLQSTQLLEVDLIPQDSILPCFGALTIINAVILGGTPPYSIYWSDADTNQQRFIGAGYNEVEITDANGCLAIDSILITEPDSLEIAIAHTDMSCSEGATAALSSSGGVTPYSYLWNTGDTTATIDSLWELRYWVVVTDLCGVSVSDTIDLNYYELNTALYYDDSSHTAEVLIESTTSLGPFEYIWLDILADTIGIYEISPILCEGIYFVVTNDVSNNCSVTDTLSVEFYIPLGLFDITTTTIYADSNLWGFPPYTYLWSNGEDLIHSDICPGNHWVEVTDINNCLVREDFTIENIMITLDPASAIIECDLENIDIDLTASATGGTGSYYYEWWNGSTANPINLGINPGNFNVSVSDANDCSTDTSFVIATMTSECIPNVFTPNGDTRNDTWSLEDSFLFEDSEIRIYNRFGRLVFQSIGYHDKWDGTNEKGNDIPDGTYFYSIEIGHGLDKINGTVTILR